MYYNLQNEKKEDFRFNRKGAYNNETPIPRPFRKKMKVEAKRGRVCPGCGIQRSVANKCECNS
jgi:hypothetical protein